jgi:plasmid maintenance system antidote protein VapI
MRIQNGEYTERGLARLLGISQPQMHHVLKGTRRLQPEFADRLMARFGVTVLDLLQEIELTTELHSRQSDSADLRWYTAPRPEQERAPTNAEFGRRRKPAGRYFGSFARAEKIG